MKKVGKIVILIACVLIVIAGIVALRMKYKSTEEVNTKPLDNFKVEEKEDAYENIKKDNQEAEKLKPVNEQEKEAFQEELKKVEQQILEESMKN